MKKLIIGLGLMLMSLQLLAQVNTELRPPNFKQKIPAVQAHYLLPKIDNEQEREAEQKRQESAGDKMYRFGKEVEVDLPFFSLADHYITPNGNRISQFQIESKGAISINLILEDFHLASGATMFLTSEDGRYVGAYTSINNNEAEALGTEILKSDKITVVVEEPAKEIGNSRFTIKTIVHGYYNIDDIAKGLNTSGDCNVDVNCPLGVGWEQQRNSVAMMVSGGGFCTGALVNNTSGNIIPYFLSARHCGTNPTSWVFRFRWEAPQGQTVCAGTSNSGDGPTTMNVNGGVLRAQNGTSDFILVELNAAPNPSWGVYYNGWDKTDQNNATSGTGIHHPDGDIKKICQENQALSQTTISFNGFQNRTWRISDWDAGVTEPGSSGSPLFNQDKKLIGVLSGGQAACVGTNDNNQPDYYGRFGYAWDSGATPDARLKDWLDPNNTGITVLDGVDPATGSDSLDASLNNLTNIETTVCGTEVQPKFNMTNAGTNVINFAKISYGFNGSYNMSYYVTSPVAAGANFAISLPTLTSPTGSAVFNAKVDSVNAMVGDQDPSNDVLNKNFTAVNTDFNARLHLELDCYGSETSWELKAQSGAVLYSGGPYTDDMPDTIEVDFCLSYGCYNFIIKDSYGDGMTGCTSQEGGNGMYTLTNLNDNNVLANISEANANFGSTNTQNFCVDSSSGLKNLSMNQAISLSPNPGSESMTIKSESSDITHYIVYSSDGKMVIAESATSQVVQVNTSSLNPGVYLIHVETTTGNKTLRWVKK